MPLTADKISEFWIAQVNMHSERIVNLMLTSLSHDDRKSMYSPRLKEYVYSVLMENNALRLGFNQFLETLFQPDLRMTARGCKPALIRFCEIPTVQAVLTALQTQCTRELGLSRSESTTSPGTAAAPTPDLRETPSISPSGTFLRETPVCCDLGAIARWVIDKYAPISRRHILTDEHKQRRYDSLAFLLASRATQSACTSVTILSSVAEGSKIVIAVNVDSQGMQESLSHSIRAKLEVLQRHLSAISREDYIDIERLAGTLAEELFPLGSPFPRDIFNQAVLKIVDAVHFDSGTFTVEEKQALLNASQATILLPAIEEGVATIQMRLSDGARGDIPLDRVPGGGHVKFIHTEQLLAYYLYHVLSLSRETPFTFGISKLCCNTCVDYLAAYPAVSVRGHHGLSYVGVINLADGSSSAHSSSRPGETHAVRSPPRTPLERMGLLNSGGGGSGASEEVGESPAKRPRLEGAAMISAADDRFFTPPPRPLRRKIGIDSTVTVPSDTKVTP